MEQWMIFVVLTTQTLAFLPSQESTNGRPDFTHASITQAGIYYAAADVITNVLSPGKFNASDPDSVIIGFFGQDALIYFANVVVYIVTQNNLAQKTYSEVASRTMNSEQIHAGNIELHNLRKNIIMEAKKAYPNWNATREFVGEYLFTLQEFYSNTNWVEMFRNQSCKELGISGRSLPIPVANGYTVTCVDCDYTVQAIKQLSCAHNIKLDGRVLTSGYTSYQHIPKPLGPTLFPSHKGKCSHGGQYDKSRMIPATGGINKETSNPELSPHFHLHGMAGLAAIQATKDFFIGKEFGLLSKLGIETFRHLLGMHYRNPCYNCLAPGLSVVFVIDDTGSMGEEIRETAMHSVDIVNQALLLGNKGPNNYILSTFNDPETTLQNTTNGQEMKRWLLHLSANGGGDCPEMAMAGLINASRIANPGSCLFFFTDADAKDANNKTKSEFIELVNSKNLHPVYFLRGDCGGGRKKRSTFTVPVDIHCIPNDEAPERVKRGVGGLTFFSDLAQATGGKIVHTTSGSLGAILSTFVENNLRVKTVAVDSFKMNETQHSFLVDLDLSLLTVKIEGYTSSTLNLKRPDGTDQDFTENATMDIIQNTAVISIQKPYHGEWTIHKTTQDVWFINIGGHGNIDFSYEFKEQLRGLFYPIEGTNPIVGSNITISISVQNLPKNSSITDIVLRKPNGKTLIKLPIKDTSRHSTRLFYAEFQVPSQEFIVSIRGIVNGTDFTREKLDQVIPASGRLEFVSQPEKLVPMTETQILINVTNTGDKNQTFHVELFDSSGYLVETVDKDLLLKSQESREINVIMNATSSELTKLAVTLSLSGKALQIITRTFMDNKCACPQEGNSSGAPVNARLCNITCTEDMYCGGKDYVNIYNVVEQTDLDGAMLVDDPDYKTCLTYQCLNNTHTLTERNCEDSSITDVACNDYFSCTFEFGEPCFLVPGDFDWKRTNTITRERTITAYEGSLFAYVDDLSYPSEHESHLFSGADFLVKKWCLRFRYFISSEDPTASMTVFIYDDNSKIVLGSVNYNRNVEWQYTAINIDPEVVFKIIFRTIRATGPSIFAIDDVTLIAGTCEETTTQLLYMKGKLRCNFEDSGDICFNQSKEDDFDWTIKSGRTTTRYTGPSGSSEGKYYSYIEAYSRKNMTARLISKFDLQDTKVTFSMQYHMYGSHIGTLTVFLRNRTRGEWIIFRKSGNQGTGWISFEETFIVEGTWQLCIEAITKNVNGNRGDIAIDDVRIRINENDFKKTWMNLNERCIRNLGSYPLTKDQVPNTPCLSSDQERWTGIVRPQRNGPTDRVLERSPSAVKVFRFSGNMSIYTWETFDRDTLRPFVCEKLTGNFSDGNYSCSMYSKAKDAHSSQNAEVSGISSEIPVVILAGVSACVLVVLICVVAMVTVYKRKKKAMGTQLMRDENVNTSEDFNSNDISLTESRPSGNNRTQNQTLSEKSPTTDEIYVNQDKTITHPKNIAKEHEDTEEDYDHLHQIRSDVTSTKDDVYSHMTDGLYGSREVKQMVNDEIYDHTMDNEYGVSEVNQGDNETYDHAGFGAPDEVYSLPNKCSEFTDNVGLYDSTTRNNNSAL